MKSCMERPTFLLQMERVLVAAMCYAVKSRIINEELVLNRDTWGKWLYGIWEDTRDYLKLVVIGQEGTDANNIMRQRSSRSWEDQECDHLREAQHLVRRPVSTEEIQIALYSLWPDLTDPKMNQKDSETNHLKELVQAHRGIVDMHGDVTHIFDSDGHATSILRRRNRTVRCDESSMSSMYSHRSHSPRTTESKTLEFGLPTVVQEEEESRRSECEHSDVVLEIDGTDNKVQQVRPSAPAVFKLAL